MVSQKTLGGDFVQVTEAKATGGTPGGGVYRVVYGIPQAVCDFLTENRIPMQKVIHANFTSNAELAVLYHL